MTTQKLRESDLAHLVMVQQLRDVPGHEDPGVVAVEAEPVSLLLYPGVETPAVPPEADTEQVLVLGRVSQQKVDIKYNDIMTHNYDQTLLLFYDISDGLW